MHILIHNKACSIVFRFPVVAAFVLASAINTGFAQTGDPAALFATHEPLILELKADFGALEVPKEGQGRKYLPGEIIVDGKSPVPVRIAVRGKFRAEQTRCRVPMLWLRFEAGDTAGSVFSGQGDIPLTTQCKGNQKNRDNVLQEYLAYRMFQELSPHGLDARLVLVTFTDVRKSQKLFGGPAFFVEHFDHFASRIGAQIVDIDRFDPRTAPPVFMATHDLFQFLIANTDWSVVYQHNTLLVKLGNGDIAPVPFDFDWAGLVNASYAYPSDVLKTRSVRTRVYRGLCFDNVTYDTVKAKFVNSRSSINAMIDGLPGMSDRERFSTITYIDDFYDILGDQQSFAVKIRKKCRTLDKF